MGNAQSAPASSQRLQHRLSKPPPPTFSTPVLTSMLTPGDAAPVVEAPQPCRCQRCFDHAVPQTPLEEFLEFRRQVLSRADGDAAAAAAAATNRMDNYRRRFSRSKATFARRLSFSSPPADADADADAETQAVAGDVDTDEPVMIPDASAGLVGLGLIGDGGNSPSCHHQPRSLVSARRRSFNIPGVPSGFPLFGKPRYRRHSYNKGSPSDLPRRSWTDAGTHIVAATPTTTTSTPARPRTASPTRATSPCEQGYTHLGRFKFGSLHVVNGCVSPAPSSKRQLSCPDLKSMAQACETESICRLEPEPSPPTMASITTSAPPPHSVTAATACPPTSPPPIPLRSSSRLNGRDAFIKPETPRQKPSRSSIADPRSKLTPLATVRRPSVSWFDDSPTSPPFFSSPESVQARPLTPSSVQPASVLNITSKSNEYDDNLFDDEGMEIPVYWDDTVLSHESFQDVKFHKSLNQERQHDSKHRSAGNRSSALNKTDSGYSSASAKSKAKPSSKHRHSSSAKKKHSSGERAIFDEDTSQDLIQCNGSINDPVEGTISIISHGSKGGINAVFPWPPANLRYPVEPYHSAGGKQPSEDTMSEYNLDPTYPVRSRYEPSRPPPIPPQFKQAGKSSSLYLSKSQHTQYKDHPKGLAISGLSINKTSTSKTHSAKNQSQTKSNATKIPSRKHRDSTPARMMGEKPRSASQIHTRAASDLTSSRLPRRVNTDKPLPALPPTKSFKFPSSHMPTPPISRTSSVGDLKLNTSTSPDDLIDYITNHTPTEIDSKIWGSLSADPDIDLELLPLNLDLNKSALHDYMPTPLQDSINQFSGHHDLQRSASRFSIGSSIDQKPSRNRYSIFPPSPTHDGSGDYRRRSSRRARYQSGPPPISYCNSQSKPTNTERRLSQRVKPLSSSSCALQASTLHHEPGALNMIERYI